MPGATCLTFVQLAADGEVLILPEKETSSGVWLPWQSTMNQLSAHPPALRKARHFASLHVVEGWKDVERKMWGFVAVLKEVTVGTFGPPVTGLVSLEPRHSFVCTRAHSSLSRSRRMERSSFAWVSSSGQS